MGHFHYRGGQLYAEEVCLEQIAQAIGTPFYCYSQTTLSENYHKFSTALHDLDPLICFALKSNSNQAVIASLARLGSGMDIVSGGELMRALAAGVPAQKIVYSGVGKTMSEHALALDSEIFSINVESEAELEQLARLAKEKSCRASIMLRVNPDVDGRSHDKTTTGRFGDKFGIDWDRIENLYRQARELGSIHIRGVATHIGSQIFDLDIFEHAFEKIVRLTAELRADNQDITHIDFGGGLALAYDPGRQSGPNLDDYAALIRKFSAASQCRPVLEPGRCISAPAGLLVTKILYFKHSGHKRFMIVDAAMNDLIRPTLYDAFHDITALREPASDCVFSPVDIVGPVCETGDFLARARNMPEMAPGAFLAVHNAGAYGAVQSGTYNSRPLCPEILVNGAEYAVIRERQDAKALIGLDKMPSWL